MCGLKGLFLPINFNKWFQYWGSLLANSDLPFIKVELLRGVSRGVSDLSDVFEIIESRSDYSVVLISSHLSRVFASERDSPHLRF